MSDDKAAQAREGLLDNLTGKAKEIAGAVTGKDDLVEEGQLQQAEATRRKEAVADQAIAEAERHEAATELDEAHREAAAQQSAAHAQAEREQAAAQQQRAAEHATASQQAERQEAAGTRAAEAEADALAETRLAEADGLAAEANATEKHATDEQLRLEREAAAADHQAAQLRAEAHQ